MHLLVPMLAVLLGGLVKGVTGFGSAIVAVPLCSLVMPPAEAIFLVALTDLFTGAWLGWKARGLVRVRVLLAMLLPAVAAQWLGTSWLQVWPVHTTRAVVGVVVVPLALGLLVRPVRADGPVDHPDADGAVALGWAAVAGVCAGLLSGVAGMPGPPLVAWVRRYLSDAAGRAQLIAVFLPAGVALVTMLLGRGLVPPATAGGVVALVPCALAGASAGAWLAPRVAPARFGRLVGALLLVSCVGLLWG